MLNTTTYIASSDFISHVAWVRSSNQSDLVLSSSAPNDSDSSSNRATCAVVGTVSPNRLYLEPHGNFNPNFENTALETSKAQFQLIAPSQPDFEADFNHGLKNIETVQRMACKEGPGAEHFVVSDGGKKALKFSWPLFEKRVRPFFKKFLIFFLAFKLTVDSLQVLPYDRTFPLVVSPARTDFTIIFFL